MYQISADDIGCIVVVEASLADDQNPDYYGTAVGEIGPFDLDPASRRAIDNSVAAGGSRFPVRFFKTEEGAPQDFVIHVASEELKIVQPGMTER